MGVGVVMGALVLCPLVDVSITTQCVRLIYSHQVKNNNVRTVTPTTRSTTPTTHPIHSEMCQTVGEVVMVVVAVETAGQQNTISGPFLYIVFVAVVHGMGPLHIERGQTGQTAQS